MPAKATNGRVCLDKFSLLVRVISETKEEGPIAAFVKIGFYEKADFDRIKTKKWEHLERDLILIRLWRDRENTGEDTLENVPQKAIFHNVPEAMWGDEAVGRIASALGKPIEARTRRPLHPHPFLLPPLEVCVVVDKSFGYPPNVRIRLESNEGTPSRDTMISIEYEQRVPYCNHCGGFGHWSKKCKGWDTEHEGRWAQTISAAATVPAAHSGDQHPKRNWNQNQIQIPNTKNKKRRARSHRRSRSHRRVRMEYRPVQPTLTRVRSILAAKANRCCASS